MVDDRVCLYCLPDPCEVGYGLCHCGCGATTPRLLHGRSGHPTGTPTKHLNKVHRNRRLDNHDRRQDMEAALALFQSEGVCPHCGPSCAVGGGVCHCGCGRPVTLSPRSKFTGTWPVLRGMPRYYSNGHASAKLNPEIVAQIRREYATDPTVNQSELARRLGVSNMLISKIMRYELWVDDPA